MGRDILSRPPIVLAVAQRRQAAEVTGSNSISVAEHVVMMVLSGPQLSALARDRR